MSENTFEAPKNPLHDFYKGARSGEPCDKNKILQYICSFPKVILWGAGNLGRELGKALLDFGVFIDCYWDKNYENIKECNGIAVNEPFTEEDNKQEILVIACIVNGSLGDAWTERTLNEQKYTNHILGMELYEGLVCPLNKSFFSIRECTNRKACSLCNCQRYTQLLSDQIEKPNALAFQLMTFIISTRCTLNCKYCGQRLSQYAMEDKKDFSAESVIRDIDRFMSAVDFVGMISIIGGEPFLHPQLAEIVNYCLIKDNFGVVNITSNGVVNISDEILKSIKNERVKVSFSVYDSYLNEKSKALLEKNIKRVEEAGISCSISRPLWVKPNELKEYGHDFEIMKMKKAGCSSIKMSAAVKDGIYYPCTIAENLGGLHIRDVDDSTINIIEEKNLRERLSAFIDMPYYGVCHYCSNEPTVEIPAGEQVI